MQTETTFQVTDSAARRIHKIMQGEQEGTFFRISVLGGGCSGFQYNFNLEKSDIVDSDTVINKEGAVVVIDDVSLDLLKGSLIDYVEDLGSAGFEIRNPNATAKCGCGNSFSVM